MTNAKRTLIAIFLGMFAIAACADGSTARDLFYNPGSGGAPAAFAVKFAVKPVEAGASAEQRDLVLSTDQTFRNGDKIRVAVQANQPAYIYIFAQGASGRFSLLYPTAKPARIPANQQVLVPAPPATIDFIAPAGDEKLVLVASRNPVSEFDTVAGNQPASSGGGQLSSSEQAVMNQMRSLEQTETKDLVYSPGAGNDQASYAANPKPNGVVVKTFTLKHR